MIRKTVILSLVALICAGLAVSCSASPCLDNAQKLFPAVVRIEAGDKLGSGVMVHKSGYILTSWHVVGAEKSAYVTLNGGMMCPGSVLATDQARDLALIQIAGGKGEFACASLGNSAESDGLQIGDVVAIAGYPAYAGTGSPTVSQGVLCAFPSMESVRFIQSSAQVYPGSSGGPMINCFGEVIGIVNGKYTNIGDGCTTFATAIDEASGLMKLADGTGDTVGNPADAQAAPQPLVPRICPNVGCVAPAFTLTGLDGKPVSLNSFKGRKVLLVFAGTSCPGCSKLTQCISQVYGSWPRDQLEVLVVISGEGDGSVREWVAANGVNCKVLPDPSG
ncbi:MAG: trypsin-like peptidase domain-containing protein, partial [Dehalococcoidia bacterium]